ncbi:pyridoxamine 5'-phosphate oxidase family protein [Micromonospora psammae]|uniref:pyridoxamine 5'-phosphate oxidase family protein n=1 Tax=Micromonospora sp. CPCC 205556 TaxID=3122398 RepID=UPI002FF1119D
MQDATFRRAMPATAGAYPLENRMAGPQLVAQLTSGRHAVLATSRPDGRPHAIPTGLVLHHRSVWLPVTRGAVRLANVAAHPWASVVMLEGTGPTHALVILEGPAVAVDRPDEGVLRTAQQRRRDMSWASSWIRLSPERILSYAGSAIRSA